MFNSFSFLLLYLPAVLAGYFLLGRLGRLGGLGGRWPAAWLALASLFFYGFWDWRYLPLLLGSIICNFAAARAIGAAPGAGRKRRLVLAVAANLLLLAYYKYANFFIDSAQALGADWRDWNIVLPIGISFFTFTQIAFLVDCYHGQVREYRFIHYVLFVSYFPHLIAGPVLHHKEMMPQFADPALVRPQASHFAVGLSIFVIGLAKKILLADQLSPLVGPVFASGAQPALLEAWIGALAYTFQLYFDFSGYSDMAIGLSRLFGVKLPLNFNSPYQSADIGEFWRRWHMTLSRFLRDYLYIPLGGNRGGAKRRCRNLMLTMLLGGLWHGAGWTFVVWGGMHGVYLVLHQGWRRLAGARPANWRGGALTFLAVMLAWVVFRAPDLHTAGNILAALVGGNGVGLPHGLAGLAPVLAHLGLQPAFDGIRWIDFGALGVPTLAFAALLAFLAPNTQEIFFQYEPAIERIFHRVRWPAIAWQPGAVWSLGMTALFVYCLFSMNKVTEFLYFQF
nr:MBOAT family O-acyltransferase [Rugamonas sp. CCM 8940]